MSRGGGAKRGRSEEDKNNFVIPAPRPLGGRLRGNLGRHFKIPVIPAFAGMTGIICDNISVIPVKTGIRRGSH